MANTPYLILKLNKKGAYSHEFNAVYKRYADGNSLYFDNGIQEFDNSVTITKAYDLHY